MKFHDNNDIGFQIGDLARFSDGGDKEMMVCGINGTEVSLYVPDAPPADRLLESPAAALVRVETHYELPAALETVLAHMGLDDTPPATEPGGFRRP